PVIIVIMATLGVILIGVTTPTDAGACGAFVVLVMTVISRTITWQKLKNSVYATLEVSCMILLLVAASNYFGAVFSRLGSANMIAEALLQPAAAADDHACHHPRGDLPAWLAARVGANRADRGADPAAPDPEPRHRSCLVLHFGRSLPANCLAFSARRLVGLFSQGGRAKL